MLGACRRVEVSCIDHLVARLWHWPGPVDTRGGGALALCTLGLTAGMAGGANAMRPYLQEGLELARSSGFPVGTVYSIVAFNWLRMFQSDPEEPRRLAEEAVAVARAQMDRHTPNCSPPRSPDIPHSSMAG